jgi:hypothetical protein
MRKEGGYKRFKLNIPEIKLNKTKRNKYKKKEMLEQQLEGKE